MNSSTETIKPSREIKTSSSDSEIIDKGKDRDSAPRVLRRYSSGMFPRTGASGSNITLDKKPIGKDYTEWLNENTPFNN